MSDLPYALTLDEAAKRLGFSDRGAIYRMEERGEIHVVRLGRKAVVPSSEIVRLLTPEQERYRVRKIKLVKRAG